MTTFGILVVFAIGAAAGCAAAAIALAGRGHEPRRPEDEPTTYG
jgi:hypothetical protein